jgi:hemoglobin-like flavoprotein
MQLDLETLETTFDLVAPRGEELMDVFYARLFATAPAVKPLFGDTDLARQKAMLLSTLVLLRKSLRNLDAIVPTLRALGARHHGYGAQPEHYAVVGQVLIASLAEIAGGMATRARARVGGGVRGHRGRDAQRRPRRRARHRGVRPQARCDPMPVLRGAVRHGPPRRRTGAGRSRAGDDRRARCRLGRGARPLEVIDWATTAPPTRRAA